MISHILILNMSVDRLTSHVKEVTDRTKVNANDRTKKKKP